MQQMQSIMTADPAVREEVFQKAEEEGFALLQRNVAPQAGSVSGADREERSRTVAKGKTFAELRMESSGGLLPRRTDRGLDLIYWLNRGNGDAAGFFLDTEAIRDMIAGAVPDLLTEVRVLAVLDDRGEPLVRPEIPALPDWRRPFVAREISPLLPGWEAGSWLVDPEFVSSRARFAVLAVWILTAVLFVVILAGGVSVIRMLSAEIRTARQKATFAASVSHELKTPLTSIRLFAEMLLSGRTRSEEKKNEYLRTMVSEAERLSRLVDNVLTFSGKGNGGQKLAMESLDLAELAAGTADQLQPHLAGNGFSLSFMGQKRLPVTGDREALRQVLMNLLSNGEKYSGDRREITVECRAENGMAVIDILDRGIGVDPRHSEKIFQEFFREDDSLAAPKGGAGLGLPIARDIARRHGGDVLYAPRDGGEASSRSSCPLTEPAKISGGEAVNERILVAEDDPSILTAVADLLESEGYGVETAMDGTTALDLFRSSPPDLVLLDVMMPGMNGYDVCRAIRGQDARVPVVMLTAKGQEVDKVVGLELGADDYIVKPFGMSELLRGSGQLSGEEPPPTNRSPGLQ